MSMISGLIDELNKSADEWNGSNMFELARMCREAADTIWQLRDDLQRANADNAKLRELVSDFWTDMNTCHLNGDVPDERDLDFYRPRVHEFGITDISERELRVDVG